jgi:hypothetical protein
MNSDFKTPASAFRHQSYLDIGRWQPIACALGPLDELQRIRTDELVHAEEVEFLTVADPVEVEMIDHAKG